jgi:hypothetical protein
MLRSVTETPESLAARADELARSASEDRLAGQARRAVDREIAELRQRALAGKPYPVLICETCLVLTGWRDEGDRCPSCAWNVVFSITGGDGRQDFDDVARALHARPRRIAWRELFASNQTLWRRVVEPGETGPVRWEAGFELDVADRYAQAAPNGEALVRFRVRRRQFQDGGWVAGGSPRHVPFLPAAFAESLETSAIAEAWFDYREDVRASARRAWQAKQDEPSPPWPRRRDLGTPTWLPE